MNRRVDVRTQESSLKVIITGWIWIRSLLRALRIPKYLRAGVRTSILLANEEYGVLQLMGT